MSIADIAVHYNGLGDVMVVLPTLGNVGILVACYLSGGGDAFRLQALVRERCAVGGTLVNHTNRYEEVFQFFSGYMTWKSLLWYPSLMTSSDPEFMASLKDISRYQDGIYRSPGDGVWKAADLAALLSAAPSFVSMIHSYADVGCGDGEVFAAMLPEMEKRGFKIERACGYDIGPVPEQFAKMPAYATMRQEDFLELSDEFDLISLIDVVEHVLDPVGFIKAVAPRCRYLLLHIPLDDRLSVLLSDQWNYRLQSVGHISFWNPASALTMLSAAGVEPLVCRFTGGFRYPSGRVRRSQRLVLPFRWMLWKLSPGLAASTIGGVSLAVLCKGCSRG